MNHKEPLAIIINLHYTINHHQRPTTGCYWAAHMSLSNGISMEVPQNQFSIDICLFASKHGSGLQVSNCFRASPKMFCFKWVWNTSCVCEFNQVTSRRAVDTPIKILLPHELLHCLATSAGPYIFQSIMLGNMTGPARKAFFEHLLSLDAWKGHPVMANPETDLEAIIPICFHADGAQFYRDDEFFVWSVSSAFGAKGAIKDVLMTKYPMAIVPEKYMRDHHVLGWKLLKSFCLFVCLLRGSQPLTCYHNWSRAKIWLLTIGTRQHQQTRGWDRSLVHGDCVCRCVSWVRLLWWELWAFHLPGQAGWKADWQWVAVPWLIFMIVYSVYTNHQHSIRTWRLKISFNYANDSISNSIFLTAANYMNDKGL